MGQLIFQLHLLSCGQGYTLVTLNTDCSSKFWRISVIFDRVVVKTCTERKVSQIYKFWLSFEVMQSRSWKMSFLLIFDTNFERIGYKIWTKQTFEKMGHPSLGIDLLSTLVRFNGLRTTIADKSSVWNHYVRFFGFSSLTSYTLLEGYFSNA